mmetsp:Transcript_20712/g.29761  ORF Transcript_20712/g.29761 Transcript_20712/m.29761 type:complete len:175 (+) Transcript_20712:110-634(+)
MGAVQSLYTRKLLHNSDTEIHWNGMHIGDREVSDIANALQKNTSLKTLDLKDNSITDKGASLLINALQVNTTLIQLNLDGNSVSDDTLSALSQALIHNNAAILKKELLDGELNLDFKGIKDSDCAAVAEVIRSTTGLTGVRLGFNNFSRDGVEYIAASLTGGCHITYLQWFEWK